MRIVIFVISAPVAVLTAIVIVAAAFLSLNPPMINASTAEYIRTWGILILAISAVMALVSLDRRWVKYIR